LTFNPELCRNESEVESKLIVHYLLPKLGYSPDTWHQEVKFGKIRLDFLAFTQGVPFRSNAQASLGLVIEAKSPRRNLDKHVVQLRNYLTSLSIAYGLLTNGKELRIYHQSLGVIQLIFRCAGRDIADRLPDIIQLIGRDFIQEKFQVPAVSVPAPALSPSTVTTTTVAKSHRMSPMKTIAIYHNKGGVGKTTVSTNLAAAFSKKGYRVLLIDIDAQANSTFATGLVKFQFEEEDDLRDRNVCDLITSAEKNFIHEIARTSQYFNNPEIDVIPAHINLIDKQSDLTTAMASRTRLLNKLKHVTNSYDLVIIDTPPSRDIYAEVALITADYLIIPSDLKPFANQGLPTVKNFLKDINENRTTFGREPIELLGVLASKISTNSKFIQHTFPKQREVIGKRYEMPLLESVIYDRTALSESFNKTILIGETEYPDPKSIFKYADEVNSAAQTSAMEFEMLADEVLTKIGLK
jgi:chromosome partitioning protein